VKNEEEPVHRGADCLGAQAGGTGTAVPEICRKLGIAEQTFYRWRSKYAGMLPSDLKRLKVVLFVTDEGWFVPWKNRPSF